MASADKTPSGPDFTKGVRATDLAEGAMLVGRVGDDEVILARLGGKLFAVSAHFMIVAMVAPCGRCSLSITRACLEVPRLGFAD